MPDTPEPTPLRLWEETVSSDWVDYNGHMNVAYYVLIFDHATDALQDKVGLDEKLRLETGSSVFVAEAHITYDNEVMEGEKVRVETQILDHDAKRLHLFHTMYNTDGSLCATNEVMILHVNLNTRKVGPFPAHVSERIASIYKEHAKLPAPEKQGRVIAVRRG